MSTIMHNFRKYQKAWLAVFGVLIIFTFTVGPYLLDTIGRSQGGQVSTTVVTYKGGRVNEEEMYLMVSAHVQALRGCQAVANAGIQKGQMPNGYMVMPMYGIVGIMPGQDEATAMQVRLLAEKARQLGMTVDDTAVTQFLRRLYGVPSTSSSSDRAILAALRDMLGDRMSDLQFYEQMKTELLAQNMRFLGQTVLSATDPQTFSTVPPPSEAYAYFERLNKNSEIESYPIKTEDFLDDVKKEPTTAQLRELYEKHKEDISSPFSPDPGFRVPPKVALQYVMADFDKLMEEEKAKITEEQIKAEYEKGVAAGQFNVPELQEEDPAAKDDEKTEDPPSDLPPPTDLPGDKKKEESPPADTKPEDSPETDSKPEDKPSDEPKTDEPKTEEPKADEPAADEAKADKSESKSDEGATADNGCQAAPANATSADEKPAEDDTTPPAEEKKAADEPADEDKPSENVPDDEPTTGEKPATEAKPGEEKPKNEQEKPSTEAPASTDEAQKPKVQPLEKVRDEILRTLAAEPAQKRLNDIFKAIEKDVTKFQRETARARREVQEETDAKKKAELKEELRKFDVAAVAKAHQLESRTIPLSGPFELDDYAIGKTTVRVQGRPASFVQAVFQQNRQHYQPDSVTSFSEGAEHVYLYWLTDSTEDYVPTYEEAREDVEKAWKLLEAQKLAEAAAKEEAERVKDDQTLKDVFGEKVSESGKFTWLRAPNMPFGMGGQATLSPVTGVEQAGEEFMKSVFSLDIGDVGVAPNQSRSIFYVVRVTSRSPGDANLREQFVGSRFGHQSTQPVAQAERQQMAGQWIEDLEKEFKVEWQRPPRSQRG